MAEFLDSARKFAAEILESPEYQEFLMRRIKDGTLPAEIEELLWTYADNPEARRTFSDAYKHLAERPLSLVRKA